LHSALPAPVVPVAPWHVGKLALLPLPLELLQATSAETTAMPAARAMREIEIM
jgi:hypothetical protein